MVKIEYCDRCGTEIARSSSDVFENLFAEGFDSKFKSLAKNVQGKEALLSPALCDSCQKHYNSMVKEFNKKINLFLKEKDE